MQARNALLSLLAGVVVFALVTVVVTEALDPYVWPSLLVGLPVGVVLGLSAVAVTYVSIGSWQERADTGTVSTRTRRRRRATHAASVVGIVVGGVTVALLATQAVGLAAAFLIGAPVGLIGAGLAAVLVWYVGGEENGDETETVRRTGG